MDLTKIVARKLARLVFWVFSNFGSRTGYTKLIAILILSCIIGGIADIVWSKGIIVGLPTLLMIIFAIWVLDISYKEKRPPMDTLVTFLITLIWIVNALVSITGNGTFLLWLQIIWSLTCASCVIFWLFVLRRDPRSKEFNFTEFWSK